MILRMVSILAMILEYSDKKILLLGDAKDIVLIESLKKRGYENQIEKRLKIDYVKSYLIMVANIIQTMNFYL